MDFKFIKSKSGKILSFLFCFLSFVFILFMHSQKIILEPNPNLKILFEDLNHLFFDCIPLVIFSIGILSNIFEYSSLYYSLWLYYLCGFFNIIYLLTNILHNLVEDFQDLLTHSSCHLHPTDDSYIIFQSCLYFGLLLIGGFLVQITKVFSKQITSLDCNYKGCLLNYFYYFGLIFPEFISILLSDYNSKIIYSIELVTKISLPLSLFIIGAIMFKNIVARFTLCCSIEFIKKIEELEKSCRIVHNDTFSRKIIYFGDGIYHIHYDIDSESAKHFKKLKSKLNLFEDWFQTKIFSAID
ncbi:hypothetical protein HZS_4083 [Henneguya salminicola]|nr:hypothetical protein HZS_4083 [Henneguya salminicola]